MIRRRAFLQWIAPAALAQTRPAASLVYAGAFPGQVLVIDEATDRIVGHIKLHTGIPRGLQLSYDKKRIYAFTTGSGIEVIDLATRQVTNHFTLHEGNRIVRPRGSFTPDPQDKILYTIMNSAVKQIDRFEIEKPRFAIVDLEQKKVTRSVELPADEPRLGFGGSLRVSPDGKYLYHFADNVLIFDTADFKIVEKIELSKPLFPGMATVGFGLRDDPAEDRDSVTGIFNSTDPVVRRQVFGLASFDLNKRTFDFTPIGPAATAGVMGLQLTPDKKTGYSVIFQGDHGNRRVEFWVFDMTTRKVVRRVEFDGPINFRSSLSGDGRRIYIYGSAPAYEIYDAATLRPVKTVTVDADLTTNFLVLPART